jgi:hypothetical protein
LEDGKDELIDLLWRLLDKSLQSPSEVALGEVQGLGVIAFPVELERQGGLLVRVPGQVKDRAGEIPPRIGAQLRETSGFECCELAILGASPALLRTAAAIIGVATIVGVFISLMETQGWSF